jgi:rsbT co-antagonist protein RsbR
MTNDDVAVLRQRLAALERENAALKEQKHAPFSSLFEDAPVPLTVYTLDGTLLTINRAAERLWQLRRADVAGAINLLTDPQTQRQDLPAFFERARQGEICTTPPVRYDTAQSTLELAEHQHRWLELTFFPLHDESGAVSHIVHSQRDVSADMEQLSTAQVQQQQTQEELNASEAKNRALLNALPDLMFLQHRDGTYLDYQSPNDQLYAPPEVFLGKTMKEVLPSDLAQRFEAAIELALDSESLQVLEYSLPIGETISYYEARISSVDTDQVLVLIRDITERKRTEEQLTLFKLLVENSPDGIGIADSQGIFTYVNPAYGALTGYGEDMIGMSADDLLPDDSEVDVGAVIGAIMQGDGFWRGEITYQHKDGTPLPIQASVFVAYDDQGEILGIPAIVRDIAEQKQREKELHQQAQILEQVRGSIVVVDMQGVITSWNRGSERLFGYTAEDIIGKPIASVYPPEEQERLMTEVIAPLQAQGEHETESLVWSKTGERFPILLSLSLLRDDSGAPVGMIGFSTDLSEQKQMEAERAAMQEQIINAQRASLRELSTPLIPISDHVVIMPLIGTIDSGRAQQVMETLLEGVSAHQAELAILDITGVSLVDTQVAQALVRAAQAVRLLGARVMLTGIQPQIAQTLVHLGVDLSEIQTQGSLQAGIAAALTKQRYR